jgi:hypothetical protein
LFPEFAHIPNSVDPWLKKSPPSLNCVGKFESCIVSVAVAARRDGADKKSAAAARVRRRPARRKPAPAGLEEVEESGRIVPITMGKEVVG